MASPTVKLNSGHQVSCTSRRRRHRDCLTDSPQMPLVGFGLWKVNNDTCADQVYNAIKTGYRLFDGACGKPIHNHKS